MGPNQLKFVDEDPDLKPELDNKFLDFDPDDARKLEISSKFSDHDPDELPKMSMALSDYERKVRRNFYAEIKKPEEIKKMDMWQKLEYAKSLEKEFEYRKAKGFAKGVVSGATLGLSEKIPDLSPAEDDMLFGLGEITASAIPIEGIYAALGKPLIALAAKAPKAKAGLQALARMTGLGLTGATYETSKDIIKTGEIPSVSDVATHALSWALLDGALQVAGKASSFARKLGTEFKNASKVSKQQRVNNVISQLAKEGINPEVEPLRYAERAEELVTPKGEVEPESKVAEAVKSVYEPQNLETKTADQTVNETAEFKDRVKKNQVQSSENLGEIQESRIKNQPEIQKELDKIELRIQEKTAAFEVHEEPKTKIPEPIIETTGKGASEQIAYAKTSVEKVQDAVHDAITAAKTPAETMKTMYETANAAVFNFLAPLEALEKDIPVHERVSTRIKFAQAAASEVNATLTNGIYSNITGNFEHGGLKGAYGDLTWNVFTKNIPKEGHNLHELNTYRLAQQALKRQAQGLKTGIDTEMAKADVAALKDKYDPIARNIQKYNRAVLEHYGKDILGSGKIATWDKDFFTSMYRFMDNGENAVLKLGSLQPKKVTFRYRGSERKVLPPGESDIYNTSMIITNAKKNEAVLQYAKLVTEGQMPGKITKGKNALIPQKLIDELEIPVDQLDVAENLYNQTRKNAWTPEKNVLRGWKNGQPFEIQVPEQIYDIFTTFTPQENGILAKIFGKTNRLFSRGISLAPRKGISIFSRDAISSLIYSKTGENPVSIFEALSHTLNNTEEYQKFLALGGDVYAAKLGLQIDRAKTLEELITPGHEGKIIPFNGIVKFFKGYADKMGALNMAVPFAEYQRSLAQYGNTEQGRIMAALEARRVTYDPFRKGNSKIVRELGNYIPFWNVSLQDMSMLGSNLKDRGTWIKGVGAITLPTLALKYINEGNPDYDALTPEDKAAFWHIYAGDSHFRIAIPWLLGTTFKVGAEFFYDQISAAAHHNDQKAKEAWKGLTANLTEQISGSVPPILQAYVEYNTGKSLPSPVSNLFGIESRAPEVVPKRLQDLPPELQYTSKTSQLARWFGRSWGLSPVKVERLISTFGGLVAKDALALIDEMAYFTGMAEDKRPEQKEKNYLLLGNFVSDTTPSRTKYQQEFYDYLREATLERNAASYIRKNGIKDANLDAIQHKGVNLFLYNKQISAKLRLLRKIEDSDKPPAEKKAEMIRIQKQINKQYQQAVEAVHRYEAKQKSKKELP